MGTEMKLDALKPYVQEAILHGEFLLSINRFSKIWIYLRYMNSEEFRILCQDVLTGFWTKYLDKNEGEYVVLAMEEAGVSSEDEIPTGTIAEQAVNQLDDPRLSFERMLVDPHAEGFDISMEEIPVNRKAVLFVALSIHLDLLINVINKLRQLGVEVQGIITILERERLSGPTIRNKLGVELIPFLVYEEQGDKLHAVVEIEEEPYAQYHDYFI
jgi:hypothetical protein